MKLGIVKCPILGNGYHGSGLLQRDFPAAAGGTARVVFAAPADASLVMAKNTDAIVASLTDAARIPGVIGGSTLT